VSLRHATLGLLARAPASGYDLLKASEVSMLNVWPATQSQLYRELNKLADAGMIEMTDVGASGRKQYAITDDGRAELHRWVTSPPDNPAFRSAQLLRVFLLDELPQAQARECLESMRAHADSERKRYEQIRDTYDWSAGDEKFFGLAALEYGLRQKDMESAWASWVLSELDKRHRRSGA
jgi:DNA-binding PadR family transcriptional regulator